MKYSKITIAGKDYLLAPVDFLPCSISESKDITAKIRRLEHLNPNDNTEASETIIREGKVVGVVVNGTIYIDQNSDNDAIASMAMELERNVLGTDMYYTPDQLVQGFNGETDKDGVNVHAQVLRMGFAVKACLFNDESYCNICTVGLHHEGLPELMLVGNFSDALDLAMHVIHGTVAFMRSEGFKEGVFDNGTAFEKGRISLDYVDKKHPAVAELIQPIQEYWCDVPFEAVQLSISNYQNRLPFEDGYDHARAPQPILPRLNNA